MKRGQEGGDGSVTVSYGIRCQLDQIIRNNFLSRASLSFKGREAPSFSLTGSTDGVESACPFPPYGVLWATIQA